VEFDGCDDGERGIPVAKGKKSIERKTHTLTPTTMWQPIQERWGFGATLTPYKRRCRDACTLDKFITSVGAKDAIQEEPVDQKNAYTSHDPATIFVSITIIFGAKYIPTGSTCLIRDPVPYKWHEQMARLTKALPSFNLNSLSDIQKEQ
jgi:hypothetical protein